MSCPTCGTEVVADDLFCRVCGIPVATASEALSDAPVVPGWPSDPGPDGTAEPGTTPPPAYPLWGVQPRARGPVTAYGAPLARWWPRVGAMLLDGLILGVPSFLVATIVFAVASKPHLVLVHGSIENARVLPTDVSVILYVAFTLIPACYFAGFNGLGRGQTPGNRAPDIAVRDVRTGLPIGFWRGLLRWFIRTLLYVAFVIPGLVNDLFPLWHPRRQTLADMMARSVMVKL